MERTYNIIIDGEDYSKHLSLPFTINLRADEAYNNGSITLIRTDKRFEFKPYTDVIIEASNGAITHRYNMIVEEDFVEEYYILNEVFYNHKITLIERTKLLDGVFIPDFSITNPATVSSVENFIGSTDRWEQINADYTGGGIKEVITDFDGDNSEAQVLLDGYSIINGSYWHRGKQAMFGNGQYWSYLYDGWRSFYDITTAEKDTTVFNGTFVDVPTPTTQTHQYAASCRIRYDINGVWMGYGWAREHYTINFRKNQLTAYYCYNYSDKGDYGSGYNANKTIVGYTSSNPATGEIWGYKTIDSNRFRVVNGKVQIKPFDSTVSRIGCVVVKPGPWFDSIYKELHGTTPSYDFLWNLYYDTNFNHLKSNIGGGGGHFGKDIFKWASDADGGNEPSTVDEFCRRMADFAMKTQYGWNNISTTPNSKYWDAEFTIDFISVPDVSNPNIVSAKSPYTTIGEVLEKVLLMVDPAHGRFTANGIPETFLGAEVSERAYQGNNLAEILFDLGKIIRAYPELDSNNNITFNDLTPLDNPLFNTSTEGTTFSRNSDNSVSRYVSDIENVVSTPNKLTDIYSYWPSKDSFARANGPQDGFSLTPDNSTITITNSDGVYKLEKIEVKNCINMFLADNGEVLNSNTVIDLTDFCYEKSYYDSLKVNGYKGAGVSVANASKDNCFWWEQKTNVIHLEELEQQTKVAFFGDSAPETYRIQNAIIAAVKGKYGNKFSKANLNNPLDYLYKITYVEYNSTRTITEKFNDDNIYETAMNYNQQANTISGIDWSTLAQTDLLRRGSKDLAKTVVIYNLSQIPELGESLHITHTYFSEEAGKEITSHLGTYFADNINLQFDNNSVVCNLSFTKNYNKILPSVAISKEYRQYEIYAGAAVDRYVNINRYHYINHAYDENPIYNNGDYRPYFDLASCFISGRRKQVPTLAVAVFKDKDKNPIKFKKMDESGNLVDSVSRGIVIPLTYTTSGNSISLTAKLQDNFSGGFYGNVSYNIPYQPIVGGLKDSGAYVVEDARYVDDLGEAEYVSFFIINPADNKSVVITNSYPYTSEYWSQDVNLQDIAIDKETDIRIKKDNRERICFNYQVHFLTKNDDFKWHPAFLKYLVYDNSEKDAMLMKDGVLNREEMAPRWYGYNFRLQDERFAPPTSIKSDPYITADTTNSDMWTFNGYANSRGWRFESFLGKKLNNIKDASELKSVALVWPKTNEIIFHMEPTVWPIKAGTKEVMTPSVSISFFKNKK